MEGRLISDTKEIVFDPDHARFSIHTPYCGYFSGAPEEEISLSDKICVEAENERITLALIAKDEIKMDGASEYILTAMGTTGMDETTGADGDSVCRCGVQRQTVRRDTGRLHPCESGECETGGVKSDRGSNCRNEWRKNRR